MSTNERQPLLPPSPTPEEVKEIELSHNRKRLIVFTTLLTGFLSTLDLTIVATCIPTISSELQSADQEAWIGTAYLWSNVTFTPLYGRLSDIIGRRSAFLQALFLFTLGTILCGVAPNFTTLVIARFVAGMGGGGMGTVSSVILSDTFSPAERGFYQGISFAVFGAGIGLGGPIGGWLTQHFGWRAAFYAQVPIAVIALVLVRILVPHYAHHSISIRQTLKQVDSLGSASILISIGALLQLLSRSGGDVPLKHDPIGIAMAVVFPVFFLIFIYVELKVASKPVLPLSLLLRRTPLCVGIIAMVIAIVNFNMTYHLPTVFELVFQQNLSVAGAHMLPNAITMTIFAPLVGIIVRRTLRYKWATVICAIGPVISMALFSTLTPSSSQAVQWLSVVPMGAGFSGMLTLTLIAQLNTVEKHEIATATGFVFVWRSLGQVFGVGLSSAVYQSSLSTELSKRFDSPQIVDKLRHASHAIYDLRPGQQAVAREAFAIALRNTFIFGLVGALLVFLTSLAIPDRKIGDGPETHGDLSTTAEE